MKAKIIFLLKYYLLWTGISVVGRIIFLLYQWRDTLTLEAGDFWHIFSGGLRLDLSLGGYVMMLACLVMALSPFLEDRKLRRIYKVMTLPLLLFFSIVFTVDLELFRNWGYHIDTTPLMYLKTPKEAMASTPVWLSVSLILFMLVFCGAAWRIFSRRICPGLVYRKGRPATAVLFLLIGGAMLIPVRGGFNVAPMNSSFVFYHTKNMYANQAGINPVWNFIYELMHMNKTDIQYSFMPDEEADTILAEASRTGGEYRRLLRTERPNIVLLLMESFTANVVEPLGGFSGVTPNLAAIAKEGVLFDNIYATGPRSDRGMVAAISGIPSNPAFALIRYPNKLAAYPSLPKVMEENGYATRYYYAGDINFGSFRSYVTMNFQEMVTEDDFTGEPIEKRFKWGVHDEYMFERLHEDICKAPQPFMYMAFNLSSHEPFTVPGEVCIPGSDDEHKFMNAIHYSDGCIGKFMESCKKSGIWDNTLFILMADHGTRVIKHLDPQVPDAFHIPLVLAGGALAVRDTVIHTIGSQTDMVSTVLAQLGIDHSGFKYSRNLLAQPERPFAFYSYSNGAGLVSGKGLSLFNLKSRKMTETASEEDARLMKAFLQNVTKELGL